MNFFNIHENFSFKYKTRAKASTGPIKRPTAVELKQKKRNYYYIRPTSANKFYDPYRKSIIMHTCSHLSMKFRCGECCFCCCYVGEKIWHTKVHMYMKCRLVWLLHICMCVCVCATAEGVANLLGIMVRILNNLYGK